MKKKWPRSKVDIQDSHGNINTQEFNTSFISRCILALKMGDI